MPAPTTDMLTTMTAANTDASTQALATGTIMTGAEAKNEVTTDTGIIAADTIMQIAAMAKGATATVIAVMTAGTIVAVAMTTAATGVAGFKHRFG